MRLPLAYLTKLFAAALFIFSLPICLNTWAATASVGAIPAEFEVDEMGGANYTVPIAVPPGTASMQPSLSFNYDSHDANGLLGMGWSLGGLSAISRCPATLAQDNFSGGVNFDTNDRFSAWKVNASLPSVALTELTEPNTAPNVRPLPR